MISKLKLLLETKISNYDSTVLGSYAHFMWEAAEEDDDDDCRVELGAAVVGSL